MPELICTADDRAAWLAARSAGVTATDIVTIMGLRNPANKDNPSVYSLFWQKMGQVPEPPDNDRWRLGRALEPYALARWCEATGQPFTLRSSGRLYRSSARPWQMATPDANVSEIGSEAHGVPVEVKTWADADRDSWGASGGSEVPPAVRAQVLWQMDVMDASAGHVGVLFLPSGEFRHYTVRHDSSHVGAEADVVDAESQCEICPDLLLMRAAGHDFMARLRMELPPPDPDSSAATLAAVKARFAKAPGKRGQVERLDWEDWLAACEDAKAYEDIKRAWEIKLREQLGEADEIEVDGQLVGRRMVIDQNVKAHVRHMDYLKRIKSNGSNDE